MTPIFLHIPKCAGTALRKVYARRLLRLSDWMDGPVAAERIYSYYSFKTARHIEKNPDKFKGTLPKLPMFYNTNNGANRQARILTNNLKYDHGKTQEFLRDTAIAQVQSGNILCGTVERIGDFLDVLADRLGWSESVLEIMDGRFFG